MSQPKILTGLCPNACMPERLVFVVQDGYRTYLLELYNMKFYHPERSKVLQVLHFQESLCIYADPYLHLLALSPYKPQYTVIRGYDSTNWTVIPPTHASLSCTARCSLSDDGVYLAFGGAGDNTAVGAAWVFKDAGSGYTQFGPRLVGTGSSGLQQQGKKELMFNLG